MSQWVPVGTLSDIPVEGARRVVYGDRTVAVFKTKTNEVFALEDRCPHKAGPLSNGIVHGDCVTCPLHNWVISLRTGLAQGADEGATQTVGVRVVDGQIEMDLTTLIPAQAEAA